MTTPTQTYHSTHRQAFLKKLSIGSLLFCGACSSNLYALPDPPPKSEWVTDASEPDAESRQQNLRYLEARTAVLQLFSALSTQNERQVTPLLAPQTVAWITQEGTTSIKELLNQSNQEDSSEKSLVELLLAKDLSHISDEIPGIPQEENENRVELFAKQSDGTYQKITMIRQGNQWVLLRTEPPQSLSPTP